MAKWQMWTKRHCVRVKVGGFSRRANWMQLTQESLKKINSLVKQIPSDRGAD
ncbi:MAG: hypothetical protein CM1200mP29_13830 [Verrucomicrobiota bacterium]|nr:MAG: hypothetical protein CM1200mP29_13830 [Verrucomicrobiota bacterium]